MKKSIILLILVILLSGCVGVEKEQTYTAPDNSTITFNPDNSFVVHYTDTGNTWAGAYKIHNNTYEITFAAMGLVRTFRINGTQLIEQDGTLWQMR